MVTYCILGVQWSHLQGKVNTTLGKSHKALERSGNTRVKITAPITWQLGERNVPARSKWTQHHSRAWWTPRLTWWLSERKTTTFWESGSVPTWGFSKRTVDAQYHETSEATAPQEEDGRNQCGGKQAPQGGEQVPQKPARHGCTWAARPVKETSLPRRGLESKWSTVTLKVSPRGTKLR